LAAVTGKTAEKLADYGKKKPHLADAAFSYLRSTAF
jgi:hypothetical protein